MEDLVLDPLDRPRRGAQEIGEVLNLSPEATQHWLRLGKIDATKIGGQWCSTARRILAPFSNSSKPTAA